MITAIYLDYEEPVDVFYPIFERKISEDALLYYVENDELARHYFIVKATDHYPNTLEYVQQAIVESTEQLRKSSFFIQAYICPAYIMRAVVPKRGYDLYMAINIMDGIDVVKALKEFTPDHPGMGKLEFIAESSMRQWALLP